MLENYFFILGLINSILLIAIFLIRKNNLKFIEKWGWIYLLLAIPAVYGIILAIEEHVSIRYVIFLGIFLAFLFLEYLFDHKLKINFREKINWKTLVPYLALYYASNYGFVIMVWKHNLTAGIFMLALFIVQIITNMSSHTPMKKG